MQKHWICKVRTKSIVVANLSSPAAHQVDFVLLDRGHLGVPLADEIYILVNLVGLDIVEDDRMDVFATGEDLRERPLHVFVKHLSLFGAVDERGQGASLGAGLGSGIEVLLFFCRLLGNANTQKQTKRSFGNKNTTRIAHQRSSGSRENSRARSRGGFWTDELTD